ncbi:hypothetical protein SNEBB_004270 [Seison nebaliae]|nr:hypothetical protein SNEBB_004270 [Seison nebaliae]
MSVIHPYENWSSKELENYLLDENISEKYVKLLVDEHGCDGKSIKYLTLNRLIGSPISIQNFGAVTHIVQSLSKLNKGNGRAIEDCDISSDSSCESILLLNKTNNNKKKVRNHGEDGTPRMSRATESYESFQSNILSFDQHPVVPLLNLTANIRRLTVGFLYILLTVFWSSLVLTFVHERVPDMTKYPPLPDIFLDNFPVINGAFLLSEVIIMCMMIAFSILFFFHRYRFIILRRLFSLSGTIFLLRSITMLITSLSVPGTHLSCEKLMLENWNDHLLRAWRIITHLGMTLHGVKTCGDYMFSGHTTILTLLTFFITEYTPSSFYLLHTICWSLTGVGIFCTLAAHEHYSIDVFVAYYIASRLFLYYHAMANTRQNQNKKRLRMAFPLFTYFESDIHFRVPHSYDWPHPFYLFIKQFFQRNSIPSNYMENSKKKKF